MVLVPVPPNRKRGPPRQQPIIISSPTQKHKTKTDHHEPLAFLPPNERLPIPHNTKIGELGAHSHQTLNHAPAPALLTHVQRSRLYRPRLSFQRYPTSIQMQFVHYHQHAAWRKPSYESQLLTRGGYLLRFLRPYDLH